MDPFHEAEVGKFGRACASVARTEQGLELRFVRAPEQHDMGLCVVRPTNDGPGLWAPFSKNPGPTLTAKAIEWILDADYSAALRYGRGLVVEVLIPARHPRSAGGFPRSEMEARRRSRSLGEMIRPSFLTEPELDRLRDYQRTGVDWLVAQPIAILADDMGLGKTAQAITALRYLVRDQPQRTALVVCPKQIMANWERELNDWAPELTWTRLSPPTRWRQRAWRVLVGRVHVIITNYEHLGAVGAAVPEYSFSALVVDEAHRVRNTDSRVTSQLRALKRDRAWALTGTPIERVPTDVWTILSALRPTGFNPRRMPPSNDALRARIKPYVLRRMKAEYLKELPPELNEHELIDLLPSQRSAYTRAMKRFRSASEDELLPALTELRLICDFDPSSKESAKLDRIVELLLQIAQNDEKGIVFSYTLEPLDLLADRLDRSILRISYLHLRGQQTMDDREDAVRAFTTDPMQRFLLASTRVGGEGLNLVEANHVIFINRWWNPSANSQAKDRVSRIGQEKVVLVHSFTAADTIEIALDRILRDKSKMAMEIIDALGDPMTDDAIRQEIVEQLRAGLG